MLCQLSSEYSKPFIVVDHHSDKHDKVTFSNKKAASESAIALLMASIISPVASGSG
jgi:hypothetical protein